MLSAIPMPMLAEKGTVNQYGTWCIEPKYDGTRAFLIQREGHLTVLHRSGKDRTNRYPELAEITFGEDLVLDGEIAVLGQNGVTDFNRIQRRQTDTPSKALIQGLPVKYYAFDILSREGEEVTRQPFTERRLLLEQVIQSHPHPEVCLTPQVQVETPSQIQTVFDVTVSKGYEGIMLKRPSSTYQARRSRDWLKVKNLKTSDLWITGYTEGTGTRERYFGALILAETPGGEPVSKVGTGFNTQTLETITRILESNTTGQVERIKGDDVHLVKSTHRAEIEFLASPEGKKNRFPSFKKLITA